MPKKKKTEECFFEGRSNWSEMSTSKVKMESPSDFSNHKKSIIGSALALGVALYDGVRP